MDAQLVVGSFQTNDTVVHQCLISLGYIILDLIGQLHRDADVSAG